MLDRDEDMMITGTRHPFLFKYKVGFTKEGLMKVLEIHVYANGGCTLDLSLPVSEKSENDYLTGTYIFYCSKILSQVKHEK